MEHETASKAGQASQQHAARSPEQKAAQAQQPSVNVLLQLQSAVGNQAVQRLLRSGVIQAKLTISQPNDPYEQEADRVADAMMGIPEPAPDVPSTSVPRIQSVCAESQEDLKSEPLEDEERPIQTRPLQPGAVLPRQASSDEELLQAKTDAKSVPEVSTGVESAINTFPGRGHPLPENIRAFMEPRFKTDFSAVRLHTDENAQALARTVNAQAFTVGPNIVFDTGYYAPETRRGRHLLAHELTHVVQRSPARIFRAPGEDDLMSVEITQVDAETYLYEIRLVFRKSTVSFQANLIAHEWLTPGDYQLSADPMAGAQGKSKNKVLFMVVEANYPHLWIALRDPTDADKLLQLTRAQEYLVNHAPVPLRIRDATKTAGGGEQKQAGGKEGGGERSVKAIAAEAWLDKELRPAVLQILKEKYPAYATYNLIGYQAPQIQEKEGPDVSMLQIDRHTDRGKTIVGHVRVYRSRWVGQDESKRAQYTDEVVKQIVAKIETAQTRQRWQSPEAPAKHGGRAYEFPPLPSRIDGLTLQPIGGSGTYAMVLDYSAAASDLLGQVSWAMQSVGYRWELWDISNAPDVKKAVKRVKRGEKEAGPSREIGKMEDAKRDFERTNEDLSQRADQIERDRAEAMAEARYADALANELNRNLLPLEVVTRYGKELLGAAADAFGDNREHTIPWTNPGVFAVRCIAAINPNAGPDVLARAPSVATQVVTTRSLESISKEAIDATAMQAAKIEADLALLKKFGNVNPEQLKEAEKRLALLRLEATGSPVEIIRRRLEIATAKRDEARSRSILIKAGLHDPEVSALDSQFEQLKDQLKLAEARVKELSTETAPVRRVQTSLVSRITGQIYPLLLQISEPRLESGKWICSLSDVTSRDGQSYKGEWPDSDPANPEPSKQRAVWEAVERFAGDANYGEGSLTVRLPAEGWFAGMTPENRMKTIESRTRDWAAAKSRLEELGTLLVALGLILSSPVTGVAGGLLAAGLAAERILKRFENDTFRWDVQAVGDILDVLGAVALGAKAIGALKYVRRAEGGFLLKAAGAVGTIGEVTETGSDVGGVILCYLSTANSLTEIGNLERSGKITATEARRQRAETVAGAIQSNGLIIGSHLASRGLFGGEPTGPKEVPTREAPVPKGEGGVGEPKVEGEPTTPKTPGAETATAPPKEVKLPEVMEPDTPAPPKEEVKRIYDAVKHLPEATVIKDKNPTSLKDASIIYYNCAIATPMREVAMYRNSETGVYIVVQGTETTVFVEEHGASGKVEAPAGAGYAQRWKELLDGKDVGHWDIVAHIHPLMEGRSAARFPHRFPTWWSGDFGALVYESTRAGGKPRTSRIDFWTGDVWAQTFFGYDPALTAEKFWIDYPDQFGKRQRIAFADLAGYHQWYRDTFGVDPELSEGTPGRGAERPPQAPAAKVPPGAATPGASPEASAPAATRQPLMDDTGYLTDAGIAFVRDQFEVLKEGKRGTRGECETPLADLSDERIRQEFSKQWRWLEAVVLGEIKGQWQERGETATEFLLANPQQNLSQIFKRLTQAAEAEGKGRHTDSRLLDEDVHTFVKQLVAGNDPVLKPAWDHVVQFSKDPRFRQLRRECRDFLHMAESEPFLLGKIGDKRPDIVEVMLTHDRATVFDATLAVDHPVHNFKTAFYIAVVQRLISGVQVEGGDFRSFYRQTPAEP